MKNTGKYFHGFAAVVLTAMQSCMNSSVQLENALSVAGDNRRELENVLDHYECVDPDPQKLDAARFLISNMPAHCSCPSSDIEEYQDSVMEILSTDLSPQVQRDMINALYKGKFAGIGMNAVPDIRIMKADYLIDNIDRAFREWRTRPWCRHVTFSDFCELILPYKVKEMQSFDSWRQQLRERYSDSILSVPENDFQRNSLYGAIDIVRNEINTKNVPLVLWGQGNSPSLLSARTMSRMTYGTCNDYVGMGVLVFRSMGMASALDMVPYWGRNNGGHSWFVFPGDRGQMEATVNSLIVGPGMPFYPYERIPKVYRSCYAINRHRLKYYNTARYVYPFDLCQKDVTGEYCRTFPVSVPLTKGLKLRDRYVYIAMAVNDGGPKWEVLDFGTLRHGMAHFDNMGTGILYIALGFDGQGLVPASRPFILKSDGSVYELELYGKDNGNLEHAKVRLVRKYPESYNVADMRRRLLGGVVQFDESPEFENPVTVCAIDSITTSFVFEVQDKELHRCWRYVGAPGSHSSLAELELIGNDGLRIAGGHFLANDSVEYETAIKAFDNDMLSNFENEQPDGGWVGVDFGSKRELVEIRIFPRSDDNDISPGLHYELLAWNGNDWVNVESFKALTPYYDAVLPVGVLLWIRCLDRGRDERPFTIDKNRNITWW